MFWDVVRKSAYISRVRGVGGQRRRQDFKSDLPLLGRKKCTGPISAAEAPMGRAGINDFPPIGLMLFVALTICIRCMFEYTHPRSILLCGA